MAQGRLVLIATPIGNREDLSDRAKREMLAADFWLVEDSRVSAKLAAYLDCKRPMRVLNEHTADRKIGEYAEEIAMGATACLLTDGGSPSISDPGALMVSAAVERGIEIDAIPGPSAVTNALALSGFFAQQFVFLGFPGRKPGEIRRLIEPFADSSVTIVFFESPFRFIKTMEIAAESLGRRRYAICREMTKMHQEIARGWTDDLARLREIEQKGEFTIVIEGRRRVQVADNT